LDDAGQLVSIQNAGVNIARLTASTAWTAALPF